MPFLTNILNRATSLVANFLPQGQETTYPLIDYKLSSKSLTPGDKFPFDNPFNYLAEMLNGLNESQPIKNKIKDQFAKDLDRATIMTTKQGTVITSDQLETDSGKRREARKEKVDEFVKYVVSMARDSGKEWVDDDIIMTIINHLQQTTAGFITTIISTKMNFQKEVEGDAQNVNVMFIASDNIERPPRTLLTYAIDDTKISYTVEQYILITPEDFDQEVQMARDMKYTFTTTIDFAYLADSKEQLMQPGTDAITQSLQLVALSKDIKVKPSELLDNSIADDEYELVGSYQQEPAMNIQTNLQSPINTASTDEESSVSHPPIGEGNNFIPNYVARPKPQEPKEPGPTASPIRPKLDD